MLRGVRVGGAGAGGVGGAAACMLRPAPCSFALGACGGAVLRCVGVGGRCARDHGGGPSRPGCVLDGALVALRARRVRFEQWKPLAKLVLTHFLTRPSDFFWPPKQPLEIEDSSHGQK